MNELVLLKNKDIFTNSLIIADGTNNEHESIVRILMNYQDKIKSLGKLYFTDLKSGKRGRPIKVYFLNEIQSTFLITLLKNTDEVVLFKLELVKQFYAMRQILLEKQTPLWQNTREESKINRIAETNEIKQLVEYAKLNGSKNADKYYITFSKLANKAVGLDSNQRNTATASQLNNLILIEHIINNVIKEGLSQKSYYKDIYQDCKNRINNFLNIAYLKIS